ncbi:MAG: GWxTD domain-containing protein [candidate division WOR-3 bacterium]
MILTYLLPLLLLTTPVAIIAREGSDLDFTFDAAAFRNSVDSYSLEFYLKIPYATLIFEQVGQTFIGRYRVTVRINDNRGEPIAGEVWEKMVPVDSYSQSKQTILAAVAELKLNITGRAPKLPNGERLNGLLLIEDMNSTKRKEIRFSLALPVQLSDLKLKKAGILNPARSYTATDTIEGYFETYAFDSTAVAPCSLHFIQNRSVLTSYSLIPTKLRQNDGIWIGEYQIKLPLERFSELVNGTYRLQLSHQPSREQKNVEISIVTPFYLSTKEYLAKVDELCYIATEEEMAQLRKAQPTERQKLWEEFWRKKDPTPTTEENETMTDYFNRIEYCKQHFGKPDKGYKSDRAKVYMKFGAPDQIESNPFERSSQPYEIWYYYSQNCRFVFVDVSGFGEYILTVGKEYLK